ncbi:hypothetical protein THTE_3746 [Thermogutta terrifontis]|uniref:Uncharacterized protein n=1 Tax=Thermogutta terrifontis TaxID=1331910 RepID=A0A286RK70_9BACT|nr:hypothetical protein THTE_3746 [Thermogutta terrifontis]
MYEQTLCHGLPVGAISRASALFLGLLRNTFPQKRGEIGTPERSRYQPP